MFLVYKSQNASSPDMILAKICQKCQNWQFLGKFASKSGNAVKSGNFGCSKICYIRYQFGRSIKSVTRVYIWRQKCGNFDVFNVNNNSPLKISGNTVLCDSFLAIFVFRPTSIPQIKGQPHNLLKMLNLSKKYICPS